MLRQLFNLPKLKVRSGTGLNGQQIIGKRSFSTHPLSKIVVLDDDPTGCQTVYDINVLLDYSIDSIARQLRKPDNLFYILTNTRAYPEHQAVDITRQALVNLSQAAQSIGYKGSFRIISRGDSTLRGHFPAETDAIKQYSSEKYNGLIMCPSFFDGGRITINDVHYLQEKGKMIPVGETPFAKDPHFGYKSSNLTDFILEKTAGSVLRNQIISFSLADLRKRNPSNIASRLLSAPENAVIIVNAEKQQDLEFFVTGLECAEKQGANYLVRSAASFVQARAKLSPRPLLSFASNSVTKVEKNSDQGKEARYGGLMVVGSYVPKTTAQLQHLLTHSVVKGIEIPADVILNTLRQQPTSTNSSQPLSSDSHGHEAIVQQTPSLQELRRSILQRVTKQITEGEDTVLYTSRTFFTQATLQETSFISHFVTSIVQQLTVQPAFVLAKGGITSHEVAQHGLHISTARVLGQIAPGVPVWQVPNNEPVHTDGDVASTRPTHDGLTPRFPDMKYVVFPGNVGDDAALTQVAFRLGVAPITTSTTNSFSHTSVSNQTIEPRQHRRAHSQLMLEALAQAKAEKRAIAAFNVYNLEGAKAAIDAAEAMYSPVILQVHPASLHFGGRPLLHLLAAFRDYASVQVFLQLDHCDNERDVDLALSTGLLDSIMIDGSAQGFEDNLRWTQRLAQRIHTEGLLVEAELGRLAGEEDGLSIDLRDAKMTDPTQAALFLRETEVDLLAVTIGNVHGTYRLPPQLDFPRLRAIQHALMTEVSRSHQVHQPPKQPQQRLLQMPALVLHGASGLSASLLHEAIAVGAIAKCNVNTDLRHAALGIYAAHFQETTGQTKTKKVDVLPLMQASTAAMTQVAREKISLFQTQPLSFL